MYCDVELWSTKKCVYEKNEDTLEIDAKEQTIYHIFDYGHWLFG